MRETAAKTKIQIVEDEDIVARDLKRRLEEMGYVVTAIVNTGAAAVEEARASRPGLILMDIMLKGEMDGISAAGEILESLDIPVIYLTAYSDEKTLERAKITEPFGYILKPFEERELHSSIEMALYKHKMEQRLKEALASIKTLKGLLPICAACKKIRDDKGYWSQVEVYLHEHSDAEFTHGYCPDCAKKFIEDFKKG